MEDNAEPDKVEKTRTDFASEEEFTKYKIAQTRAKRAGAVGPDGKPTAKEAQKKTDAKIASEMGKIRNIMKVGRGIEREGGELGRVNSRDGVRDVRKMDADEFVVVSLSLATAGKVRRQGRCRIREQTQGASQGGRG